MPEPGPEEILLKVAACGMCRSDYQLQDGYFKGPFPVEFPYIPGHEVTGRVAGLGSSVPASVGYSDGDMVVVNPSWGDEAIADELETLTGRRAVDAILDCVGSGASISMGFDLLGPEGVLTAVGLMSDRVEHRQFPFVGMELSYLGSFWGNHPDLVEVGSKT